MEFSPAVLRNRGVPITLRMRDPNDPFGAPIASPDPEAAHPTEQVWVRFDSNAISEIEMALGDERRPQRVRAPDGAWIEQDIAVPVNQVLSERLAQKQTATVRWMLSLALELEERVAGRLMLPDLSQEYATAVGVAYSLAMGTDPETAGKVLALGVRAGPELRKETSRKVGELADEAAVLLDEIQTQSLGRNGSEPGSVPDEASKNSGG